MKDSIIAVWQTLADASHGASQRPGPLFVTVWYVRIVLLKNQAKEMLNKLNMQHINAAISYHHYAAVVSSQNTIMTVDEQYNRPVEWESSETVASRPLWNFGQHPSPAYLTPIPLYMSEYFPLLPGTRLCFPLYLQTSLNLIYSAAAGPTFFSSPPLSKLA